MGDFPITGFFCLQSFIFMFGVYLIVFCFRRAVEALLSLKWPSFPQSVIWRTDVLPFLAPVLGASMGFGEHLFPWPTEFQHFLMARVMYGLTLGWLSAHVYRIALTHLGLKTTGHDDMDIAE